MGGTKRQACEMTNEMNTDTLAYILTLALEATQLELEKVRKELEALRERRRVVETFRGEADVNARIYRIVAESL